MIDSSAWDVVAEERILAAQAEGQFDRLPGFGQPIPDRELFDSNSWLKRKLKSEQLSLLPPYLEARLAREKTLARLREFASESEVRATLATLNESIAKALLGPQVGNSPLRPVDIEKEIERWRQQRTAT